FPSPSLSSLRRNSPPPPELLFTAAVFGPPPPHPATTWGGTGPKRTVPSSSFHPDHSQPPGPPVLAGKYKNPTEFNPKFKELDLPPPAAISGDQDRAIVSDPTVRSEPNLQDKCPIPYRTHRNFRIGIWRSWSPWACLTRVRVV
ncbi:HXXXD-type acyl-transferase family protein, partial [Prunus dulcis]